MPGSPRGWRCQPRPGLGGAGTSWPAVAARMGRTTQARPGHPRRGPGCPAPPVTGRQPQRVPAGQPTGRPSAVWAVPRATTCAPAPLEAPARPPAPGRRSSLRRSAWPGTGWKRTCRWPTVMGAATCPAPIAVRMAADTVPWGQAVRQAPSGLGPGPGRAGCPVSRVGVHGSEQMEPAAQPQSPRGALMSPGPWGPLGETLQQASPWWVCRPGAELPPRLGWLGVVGRGLRLP